MRSLEKMSKKEELTRLLQERNEHPERVAEIDQKIRETFAETHAIMVLDMSGFSRLTIRYGIIHFLAMIHRMNAIVSPAVEEYGGRVVKLDADDVFAVFPDVGKALDASIDILKRLEAVNTGLPEELDLYASMGIGYGEVLNLEDDMFGEQMNLASKLGEDLARRSEILLTEAAHQQIAGDSREFEQIELSVFGLALTVYKVKNPAVQ
jgi:class 3 adenylate cyclase